RFEVWRNAEIVANDRCDRRRSVGERLRGIDRQHRRGSRESWAGTKAVRIREVCGSRKADRAVLIVLRNKVASKTVVDHTRAGAERSRLSKQLADQTAAVLRTESKTKSRREIQVAGIPPRWFSVRRSVQVPAQNRVGHCILGHA